MTNPTLLHNTSSLITTPHAFFTRQGGVSQGIYASLNAGVGSDDNPAHVEENRARIAAFFGCDASQLATLRQVHSAVCLTIDAGYNPSSRPEADAFVTKQRGIILGILTADCVPVLLHDPVHHVIGAAHAGWKGARAGIVEATVHAMQALGSNVADIRAAIGPSIAQASYEVDAEFKTEFLQHRPDSERFFIPSPLQPATHCCYDNKSFVEATLRSCGIIDCSILSHDTYVDEDHYYSFRRATHRGQNDYGRQLSAIML